MKLREAIRGRSRRVGFAAAALAVAAVPATALGTTNPFAHHFKGTVVDDPKAKVTFTVDDRMVKRIVVDSPRLRYCVTADGDRVPSQGGRYPFSITDRTRAGAIVTKKGEFDVIDRSPYSYYEFAGRLAGRKDDRATGTLTMKVSEAGLEYGYCSTGKQDWKAHVP
jgi:hypothetical protein